MNPVGLTSAERASEQPSAPRVIVLPVPGEPSCRITVPPDGDACGAAATRRIVWPDGDVTLVCLDCALRMAQLAVLEYRTTLRVELLRSIPARDPQGERR